MPTDPRLAAGATVVLWSCPAHDVRGHDQIATGLYTIEEHYFFEPSNYCYTNGFVIFPVFSPDDPRPRPRNEDEDEHAFLYVEEHNFIPQAAPDIWAHTLIEERQMEIWGEMEAEEARNSNA